MSEKWDMHAILVGRQVVVVDDYGMWSYWMTDHKYGPRMRGDDGPDLTRVGRDVIGDVEVSTVFLGFNAAVGMGPPLWFETMVFSGDGRPCRRYATWDEALAGHERMVAAVREGRALEEIS